MNIVVWFIIIFIFISIAFFINKINTKSVKEDFVDLDFNTEEQIMRVYNEVLNRVPSSKELVEDLRKINNNEITIQGLEQRLIDSDEYGRMIKLQSNELTPELKKMISDRALIDLVSKLYKAERKSNIPENMRLPMKDIYIHLKYNEWALRAMYRHRNFVPFEEDVQATSDLDKTTLIKIFDKYFDINKLFEEGRKIAEEMGAIKPQSGSLGSPYGDGTGATPPSGIPSQCTNIPRNINDTDGNMDPMLENLLKCAGQVFDKDKAARLLNGESNWVKFPVKTHYGDMVLREEQAWSVPNHQVPVCTTLGQKPAVQNMLPSSKLLLGTPLDDAAKETQVGSIMPKFEYKEYVEIPRSIPNTLDAVSGNESNKSTVSSATN